MGRHDVRVDAAELRTVAEEFERIAETVGRVARLPLSFAAAVAGRDHGADGDAVRRELQRRSADLALWSRAAAEIAAGLRAGADRYTDSDRGAAARLG